MKIWFPDKKERSRERGATAIFVALSLVVFVMFTALAVDVGHLYGVKNELHNAADAGALAGANELFDEIDNLTVAAAVAEAERLTPLNSTGKEYVDDIIVETGHWSFTTKEFTPSENTTQFDDWQITPFSELDLNLEYINAVRVQTRRPDTPSFFAGIFNIDQFFLKARAVAYIGYAGTLFPFEVDQPIAICKETITVDKHYECNIGRMINSGGNEASNETGGWTDFRQSDEDTNVCQGGTNATLVSEAINSQGHCDGGNEEPLTLGEDMATNGGQITSAFDDFRGCWWEASADGTIPWQITLPVVTCPSNNIGTCEELVGAVTVNVLLVTGNGEDPQFNNVPTRMGDWDGTGIVDGEARWQDFVEEFGLNNVDGTPAPYQKKAIYFLPDCAAHEPLGKPGGQNFGIHSKYPVLVQ